MKYLIPALILTALAIAAGCGSESTKPPLVADCTSVADTTQPATVSFANDIFPLFLPLDQNGYQCNNSTCHGAPIISSEYSVSTYEDVLTQGRQARSLGLCSVKPGDPENSYLIWKLEGRAGIAGVQMPLIGSKMAPADLTLLKTWILEGARNN